MEALADVGRRFAPAYDAGTQEFRQEILSFASRKLSQNPGWQPQNNNCLDVGRFDTSPSHGAEGLGMRLQMLRLQMLAGVGARDPFGLRYMTRMSTASNSQESVQVIGSMQLLFDIDREGSIHELHRTRISGQRSILQTS